MLILYFMIPWLLHAQDQNIPYIQFSHEAILWYIPGGSAHPPLLPVIKPGFVHILQTPGFQTQPNKGLSAQLESRIRDLLSDPMNTNQKTEFLEKYACLILMNYTRVSEIDTLFYIKSVSLKEDSNQEIRENASLVVKMVDLYRKE